MPKFKDISLNEREFLLRLLHEDQLRYDHRSFDQLRDVDIKYGASLGDVEVTLGRTRLVVRVSAEVVRPSDTRPFEGVLMINTDIGSMASPYFDNHKQTEYETVLTRVVEKAIRRSNALDLESLCIVAGQSCWMIRADVHYLNFDGGLVDATTLGVCAGLLHFKKPDISIDGENTIIHSPEERAPIPLSILHIPISVTFSFFKPLPPAKKTSLPKMDNDNGDDDDDDDSSSMPSAKDIVLVDATAREEAMRDGEMTVTINKNREICQLSKAGGYSVDAYVLMNCANRAYEIAAELTELIQRKIKEDYALRDKENPGFELSAENDR